jgi:2-polyprenyl-6-methoxyphenol hydroxylase-like FAD-dependent oxidoreductase
MVRKEKLLKAFDKWHDPIQTLIEATPATEILVERAMAHRHSVGPVLNLNRVLRQVYKTSPPSSGPGPAVVFIGDSFMTVDPILAQGFTMAMEGSAALAPSVEASILQFQDTGLAFDPYELRNQLQQRHDERNGRLLHLLQATEIVQALGQPQGGLVGSLSRYVVRPLMQLAPDFIKRPIFNAMLTYSLKK